MHKLFIIQLVTSFVTGGGIIALLSFITERVPKRIAGIILTFPTTVAIGFFFLGWTLSPQAVAQVVPATLVPLGLCMLFGAFYAYIAEFCAKVIRNIFLQITVSYLISIVLWFVLAIPAIIYKLHSLAFGVAGYVLLILISHLLLQRRDYLKPVALTYTLGQKIGRAIFAGFIVAFVVFLGKTLGPFWGGMFTMFPAVFSSVLTIIHRYYGSKSLFPTLQKAAIGSLSTFAYTITTMFVFPAYGFAVGTLLAFVVSFAVTLTLMKLQKETS